MELAESQEWRLANAKVALFLAAGVILTQIPARDVWFGIITDEKVRLLLSVIIGVAVFQLTKGYVSAINAYTPATAIHAKRANEQIKLTANFGNAIATAVISVAALTQMIKPDPNYYLIAMPALIAALIHAGSRNMVANIKDESVPALTVPPAVESPTDLEGR